MFCIHCGKQIEDYVRFCRYCGGSVEQVPDAEPVDTVVDPAAYESYAEHTGRCSKQ